MQPTRHNRPVCRPSRQFFFLARLVAFLLPLFFPAAGAQAQFTIQNSAVVSTKGNATITLRDIDLIFDGSMSQQSGDGSWFFTGSGNSSIAGGTSPVLDKLYIAKTGSAKLSLSQDITIAGNINFSSGLIDLNNNRIFLQPAAFLSGESEVSRIIGDNGGYVEITNTLNAPTATNPGNLGALITSNQDLGATIVRRGHSSQTGAGASANSILRYYDILPANDVALNATLRINYFDAELNSLDESTLVLWKSPDQTHWTDMGFTGRDASANYVEASGLADLSSWTLSTMSNPLPVKFAFFTVECLDGAARITWATAQEENSSRFDIQKSTDGSQWQTIGHLAAAGNSSVQKDYSYTDAGAPSGTSSSPSSGTSGTAFYRVVEFDLDGSPTYSPIAAASCGIPGADPVVYPNPVTSGCWVTLNAVRASVLKIEIVDAGGATRQTQITPLSQGINTIEVDLKTLSPGLYFLHLQWENGLRTKIIKIEKA